MNSLIFRRQRAIRKVVWVVWPISGSTHWYNEVRRSVFDLAEFYANTNNKHFL